MVGRQVASLWLFSVSEIGLTRRWGATKGTFEALGSAEMAREWHSIRVCCARSRRHIFENSPLDKQFAPRPWKGGLGPVKSNNLASRDWWPVFRKSKNGLPLPDKGLAICWLCAALLAACTSYVAPVRDAPVVKQLGFLRPGITTREDILARFGTPSHRYEDGRIFSYRVYRTSDGRLTVTPSVGATPDGDLSSGNRYVLVLVFHANGTLDRQSLVGKNE